MASKQGGKSPALSGSRSPTSDGSKSPSRSSPSMDFEEFWNECKDIRRSASICVEADSEETDSGTKTPDEGEEESKWLTEAGYGHLVSKIEDGNIVDVEEVLSNEMASLTRQQAEAVKRRFETLNTVHTTRQQKRYVDVRQIFSLPTESTANDNVDVPPNSPTPQSDGQRHKRRGSTKGKEVINLFKNKAEYNMDATGDNVIENAIVNTGVETISIYPTGTIVNRHSSKDRLSLPPLSPRSTAVCDAMLPPFSPVSDIDFSFELILDDELSSNKLKPESQGTDDKTKDFPNYVLKPEPLGCTTIVDVSAADMVQIRSLALIELAAMFDDHHIVYYARKSKRKLKECGIFGVSAAWLLEHDRRRHPDIRVPLFYKLIIEHLMLYCLQEEGLLRVPGSQTRIKALYQEIESSFHSGGFSFADSHSHDVAAILKQFLRELSSPLLTFEYLEAFALIENISSRKKQLKALNLLILLLPDVEQEMLKMLLWFLSEVINCQKSNKMNINNVSMIIAPNLFLCQSQGNRKSVIKDFEINMVAGTSNIVRMMIKYRDILWVVPSFMVHQIRFQNESEQIKKSRSIINFLTKKSEGSKRPAINNEDDYQSNTIRVSAPSIVKSAIPITLDDKTTAADVIAKFRHIIKVQNGAQKSHSESSINTRQRRRPSFTKNMTHLFELGGNIGERCLDLATNMSSLYRVNPNAEWVIKDKPCYI